MADKKVEFEIKVIGDALERLRQITGQTEDLGNAAMKAKSKLASIGGAFIAANQALEFVKKATDKMREYADANKAQQEAEAKLAQVMRNTMGARADEIEGIKELASAQQKLGVIGDEVQLAGAQELGTYLEKTDSLKKLMPVMGFAESESKANAFALPNRSKDGDRREPTTYWRSNTVQKKRNPCEKGFVAKRLLLTGWCPSFWRLIIKEVRGLFGRVVDVELTDELEAVLEVGAFGLGEGVKETESGDESDLLGLDGHVLLGCGDYLPECGEEVLELMVGDKKLDFWRRNCVFGVVARVVEEVRDAVERACDCVVIIWKRDFYGGGVAVLFILFNFWELIFHGAKIQKKWNVEEKRRFFWHLTLKMRD